MSMINDILCCYHSVLEFNSRGASSRPIPVREWLQPEQSPDFMPTPGSSYEEALFAASLDLGRQSLPRWAVPTSPSALEAISRCRLFSLNDFTMAPTPFAYVGYLAAASIDQPFLPYQRLYMFQKNDMAIRETWWEPEFPNCVVVGVGGDMIAVRYESLYEASRRRAVRVNRLVGTVAQSSAERTPGRAVSHEAAEAAQAIFQHTTAPREASEDPDRSRPVQRIDENPFAEETAEHIARRNRGRIDGGEDSFERARRVLEDQAEVPEGEET